MITTSFPVVGYGRMPSVNCWNDC